MERDIVEGLVGEVAFIHGSFLEVIADVDEERFHARPGPKAPAIVFHLWHTARWADALHAQLGSLAPQLKIETAEELWNARGLADAWGLGAGLGKGASGAGLDDDASAALALPSKDEVASYARDAFAAAERVLSEIHDEDLLLPTGDFYDEGDWIVLEHFGWHLGHAARHLGMVEALKGVLGIEGTATI